MLYKPGTYPYLACAVTTICQLFSRGHFSLKTFVKTILLSLNNVHFYIYQIGLPFQVRHCGKTFKPGAMSKRRRFRLDLKASDTGNKTLQRNRLADQGWKTLLQMIRQTASWETEHVLPICIHLYFVLSTFSYTTLGFIFLQFSTWVFFFLTTNPL